MNEEKETWFRISIHNQTSTGRETKKTKVYPNQGRSMGAKTLLSNHKLLMEEKQKSLWSPLAD